MLIGPLVSPPGMVETSFLQAKRRCCHARGSGHPEAGSQEKVRQRLDSRFRGNDSRGITSRLQVNLLGTYHLAGGSNSDHFSKENSRK